MKKVLLDTDVLIDFLRGRENARQYIMSIMEDSDACCSSITVAELHAGMKEHERRLTTELIDGLNIMDVNRAIAEKAGEYKRSIKTHDLELGDCLIAATASIENAVLATGNVRHYPMGDVRKQTVAR